MAESVAFDSLSQLLKAKIYLRMIQNLVLRSSVVSTIQDVVNVCTATKALINDVDDMAPEIRQHHDKYVDSMIEGLMKSLAGHIQQIKVELGMLDSLMEES